MASYKRPALGSPSFERSRLDPHAQPQAQAAFGARERSEKKKSILSKEQQRVSVIRGSLSVSF